LQRLSLCSMGQQPQLAFSKLWSMSNRLCPNCQKTGRLLEAASRYAYVEYYRCDPCGHVWQYAKGDPNASAFSVTVTADVAVRDRPRPAA
jgi:rubredoxin